MVQLFSGDDMFRLFAGLMLALTLMAAPAAVHAQIAAQPAPQTATQGEAAERLALANRFIVLIQGDQLAASMRQMMTTMMPENPNIPAEQNQIIREVTGEMIEVMMPRMFDAMAPIYADIFTVEELRALVAFYESDVGQSLVRKSAAAAPRMAEVAQAVIPGVMGEMADRLCDRLECSADQRRAVKAAMMQGYPAGG